MGIIAIIFFLCFMAIHVFNGGQLDRLLPLMVLAIGVWMIDVSIMLANIAIRHNRK